MKNNLRETLSHGLPDLWAQTLGDPNICIAVLDGPVDTTHPCFSSAQLTLIQNMSPVQPGDNYATQHGTHIASVIFGRHGSSVEGIAPRCRGLIIPVYSGTQKTKMSCSQLDLARAINMALEQGAHIINISGGELTPSGVAEPLLSQAISQCAKNGTLIVAAAGNDGCQCLHIPASEPSVLAVGAMNSKGTPLKFSNWGDAYLKQGVLAPGENIPGALPGGGVVVKSGTSFATPIVSGVAALLLSLQRKLGTKPDTKKVLSAILETENSCDTNVISDCRKLLAGRINIKAAHAKITAQNGNAVTGQTLTPETNGSCHLPSETTSGTNIDCKIKSEKEINEMEKSTNIDELPPIENAGIGISEPKRTELPEETTLGAATPSQASDSRVPAQEHPEAEKEMAAPATMIEASEITAAGCGCDGNKTTASLGYVLGQLGYDFGTEANQDCFTQLAGAPLYDPEALLNFLNDNPATAANITWTLSLDATVTYAVQPCGPFANLIYDRLKGFLKEQVDNGAERVSLPGIIKGSTHLMNGQEVPVIYPDIRGMYSWATDDLVQAALGEAPKEEKAAQLHADKTEGVRNFLERIYYEVRNLGTTPQERAMNYAATNAFQVSTVYHKAIQQEMKLDSIDVERSPVCRPGSDCWDVVLTFFNPAKRMEQARHVHRFTVDVSEVIPVTVGKVRDWDVF